MNLRSLLRNKNEWKITYISSFEYKQKLYLKLLKTASLQSMGWRAMKQFIVLSDYNSPTEKYWYRPEIKYLFASRRTCMMNKRINMLFWNKNILAWKEFQKVFEWKNDLKIREVKRFKFGKTFFEIFSSPFAQHVTLKIVSVGSSFTEQKIRINCFPWNSINKNSVKTINFI